jgi:hypothetical protein
MARRTWIAIVAVVAAASFGGGLAWAFLNPGAGSSDSASPTVRQFLASPQRYYGHRVIVQGSVSAVYNEHALKLGPALQPGLLVTVKGVGLRKVAPPNAELRVVGIARRFALGAWETWTGTRPGPGSVLDAYAGRPSIRAIRIVRVGGAAPQQTTIPPSPQVRPATTSGG